MPLTNETIYILCVIRFAWSRSAVVSMAMRPMLAASTATPDPAQWQGFLVSLVDAHGEDLNAAMAGAQAQQQGSMAGAQGSFAKGPESRVVQFSGFGWCA